MKKHFLTLILSIVTLSPFTILAQSLSVNSSTFEQAEYSFTSPKVIISTTEVQGDTYTTIHLDGASPSSELGRPNLPIITQIIEIPLCEGVRVDVSNIRTKALTPLKYWMMPVQPAPSKADRTPLPFVIDTLFYATSENYSHPAAWVEEMGVGRDRNLALLKISPLTYNPATGELQLITSMDITLTYRNADIQATEHMYDLHHSPDFSVGSSVLNSLPHAKSIRNAAPLHYLIVAHSSFRGALDSFVNWKKRQGFIVTIGYTGDPNVGTTSSSIAEYTKSFYTNATNELPAPTFLLLVGDHAQIPAFNSRCTSPASDHVTDLYYVSWTQGDNIPDCYLGRFSARTLGELTPQIEKSIYYESYDFNDDSYLAKGMLIAGQDQGYQSDNAYHYADPAMDYIAKYYINASNGYSTVKYYKNNINFAPTGVQVTGSSQTSSSAITIRNQYNEGYGWVNYSAHGYDNEWSTPSFNANNAAAMTNNNKPSIMVGNCCLSGKFNTTMFDACLGEALLRKGNNAGAVAYFGATNSTYWPHDFCWAVGVRNNISNNMDAEYSASNLGMYDRLFHTHNEPNSAWHTTAGSINVAGNMAVQSYNSFTLYYWEIYELFGDPSLMPWLGRATQMIVDYQPVAPVTEHNYSVTAAPYAYVALTTAEDHDLVCAAYADASGRATLQLPTDIVPGDYELAVWAQNRIPQFHDVTFAVLDGPYVMVSKIEPNSIFKPGNLIDFDITITNLGNAATNYGTITLTTEDDHVAVVQPTIHFSRCAPGDTIVLHAVCPLFLSDRLVDGQSVTLNANVDFGRGTSYRTKRITVSAPRITASDAHAAPSLKPDSSSTITCRVSNHGSAPTDDLTFTLVDKFQFFSNTPDPVHVGILQPGESRTISFYTSISPLTPSSLLPMFLYSTSDNGTRLVDTVNLPCGSDMFEDFETGSLTKFPWSFNSRPWEITQSNVYDGAYCARSKSNQNDWSESRMNISWTSMEDDSISFYYMVSSEESYDMFHFFIDGTEKFTASGEVDWTRASYFVAAGTHTFSFSYTKDQSAAGGSDCVWLDNVTLPFSAERLSFAVDSVCHNLVYEFAEDTIPTDQAGHFNYIDTTSSPWQYLSLTVLDEPDVTIEVIQNSGSPCYLLKAHGADSYIWNTGDSTDYLTVCLDTTESFSVTGFRKGCSSEASTSIVSIRQPMTETHVSLYPNPAHNNVQIEAEHIRSVELLNIMGQPIFSKQVNANNATLDLQKIPTGIYFVRIKTAESMVVRKLIKN